MNSHSTLWHSYTDDHGGQLIGDVISNSDHITLNINTPTRVPDTTIQHHQISPQCLTYCTTGHLGQLNMHYHHIINIQNNYRLHQNRRNFTNYTESAFSQTTIHTAKIILTNIILMAVDKHNITKGKMHSNCMILPDHIICKSPGELVKFQVFFSISLLMFTIDWLIILSNRILVIFINKL